MRCSVRIISPLWQEVKRDTFNSDCDLSEIQLLIGMPEGSEKCVHLFTTEMLLMINSHLNLNLLKFWFGKNWNRVPPPNKSSAK